MWIFKWSSNYKYRIILNIIKCHSFGNYIRLSPMHTHTIQSFHFILCKSCLKNFWQFCLYFNAKFTLINFYLHFNSLKLQKYLHILYPTFLIFIHNSIFNGILIFIHNSIFNGILIFIHNSIFNGILIFIHNSILRKWLRSGFATKRISIEYFKFQIYTWSEAYNFKLK